MDCKCFFCLFLRIFYSHFVYFSFLLLRQMACQQKCTNNSLSREKLRIFLKSYIASYFHFHIETGTKRNKMERFLMLHQLLQLLRYIRMQKCIFCKAINPLFTDTLFCVSVIFICACMTWSTEPTIEWKKNIYYETKQKKWIFAIITSIRLWVYVYAYI